MVIEFFMVMVPSTKTYQEKQVKVINGKPVLYEPQELKAVRAKLRDNLAGHIPDRKLNGAVRLITKWCFPSRNRNENGHYRITKPDTDNLQKMIKDIMTDLNFWHDDAQVASEITEKFWADVPGIYIRIEELENE